MDLVPANANCIVGERAGCRWKDLTLASHRCGRGGPTGAELFISHKSMRTRIALHHVHIAALAVLLLTRLTRAMEPVQLEPIRTGIALRCIVRACLASGRHTGQARARVRTHCVALFARIALPQMFVAGCAADCRAFL